MRFKNIAIILIFQGTIIFPVIAGEPGAPQKCFEDSEIILESGVVDAITADVDGDGRDDLLALQPPTLNILRNDGENFQPYQSINVGDGITKIAAGHINNDASPDVAILRGDELVIYINSGSGYPAASTNVIPIAAGPVDLLFADLDDDGDDDVVITHTAIGQVNGILLTPNGQLQNDTALYNLSGAKKTIAANLNGDALPDLITVNDPSAIILFNRGGGIFDAVNIVFPPSSNFAITNLIAADFVHGGADEVLVFFNARINADPRYAHIYLVSADVNEMLSYDLQPLEVLYSGITALAAVDQDGDGDLDCWFGGRSGSGVPAFFLENNDGVFSRTAGADSFNAPPAILPVSMNGNRSLLVQNQQSIQLLRSANDAIMRTMTCERLLQGGFQIRIDAGDLNGDGADDLVLGMPTGLMVQWGGTRGPFQAETIAPGSFGIVYVIDMNRDGLLDIVGRVSGECVIYVQQSDGTFEAGGAIPVSANTLQFGDINDDGLIDCVPYGSCNILTQNIDGTFREVAAECFPYCPYRSALADLNGDGYDEFIRPYGFCINGGDETFQKQIGLDATGMYFPDPVGFADFDHDGDLEVIIDFEGGAGPGFAIHRNDGAGTFTRLPATTVFGPSESVGVSVTYDDIDGDGNHDFVTTSTWEGGLWYYHGNGDCTLTGAQGWAVGYMGSIWPSAVGDFDGDGALDITGVGVDTDWASEQFLFRVYGTCVVNCREDINHDDRVNVVDLFQLLKDWGHCPSCFSDLDGDDFVGRGDLDRLFDAWGACAP